MSNQIPPILSKHLAAIGAVGGAAKSAAKTKACRENARRPRNTTKHRGQQPGAFGGKSKSNRAARVAAK